jgi:hypothetical protein
MGARPCKPSRARGQPPGAVLTAGRPSHGRGRLVRVGVWLSIVSVLALQACQVLDVFDGDAPAEAEPSIEVTQLPVDPAYPNLRTVPPRPQLSYSVEQQREIVESLIGDREHARYTTQRIRYRTGLSSLPPPPWPEPDEEATSTATAIVGDRQQAPASPPTPSADVPSAGYDFGDRGIDDDAGLGDFMRNMIEETEPPSPAEVEPSPGDDAPQPNPRDSSGVAPSPEMSAAQPSHSSAAPSGGRSATRLFAWIDDAGTDVVPVNAAGGTAPSTEPDRASPEAREGPQPPDTVPVQAAVMPRHNGAEVAPRQVEVAAVHVPAARPNTNGNAPASRHDAGAPSPVRSIAAPPPKPEPTPDVQPASMSKLEPVPASRPRPGGTALATVTFADGSAELPAGATSTLEAALAALEGDGVVEIVGRGEVMTLALDRARAVAVGLMRLGAGAGALKISAEAAPAANEVRIRVGGRRS